ncbi:hypothetical protein [Pseudobacillus wudalianchiensis]|nr:hypothetical protein [Bacillus wudalianchiensis]
MMNGKCEHPVVEINHSLLFMKAPQIKKPAATTGSLGNKDR